MNSEGREGESEGASERQTMHKRRERDTSEGDVVVSSS